MPSPVGDQTRESGQLGQNPVSRNGSWGRVATCRRAARAREGGGVVPPKMKDNPRKHELAVALGQAREKSGSIPAILQGAASAMTAKAWTGGTSGDFSGDLTGQQSTAQKGGTASVEEIQHALGGGDPPRLQHLPGRDRGPHPRPRLADQPRSQLMAMASIDLDAMQSL